LTGWLINTNVIASLTSPNGAPSVRNWAPAQDEDRLFISILSIGEFEKGIHTSPPPTPPATATLPPLKHWKQGLPTASSASPIR
jgi:predicted nucleic acid-binding protein